MEKTIEIPEGYEARIEGNKVILERKESEDERIRKELIQYHTDGMKDSPWFTQTLRHKDVLAYLERQKEQKPAEWSEEDEEMLLSAIEYVQTYPAHRQSVVDWLKSLPERFNLQPKQEWSETDKQMLENIIEVIGETCSGNYTASFITKMLSWLKSLRPQPHWKPSEDGGTEKHPWNDEDVEKAYREGVKAGAEWQREQYECIPTEEAYMRGFAQGAKGERKDLTPLINRLCEAILFEWKDAADLARKTLTQIKEMEEK